MIDVEKYLTNKINDFEIYANRVYYEYGKGNPNNNQLRTYNSAINLVDRLKKRLESYRNKEFEVYGNIVLEPINFTSTVVIGDALGTGQNSIEINVKAGKWIPMITVEEYDGRRPKSIEITLEGYTPPNYESCGAIYTSGASVLLMSKEHYYNHDAIKGLERYGLAPDNLLYDVCCNFTLDELTPYGSLINGFVTRTGFGDGDYTVLVSKVDKLVTSIKIEFYN